MLATLMAWQANMPFLDFGKIKGKKKGEYIAAIQMGLTKDYTLMTKIFKEVVEYSRR